MPPHTRTREDADAALVLPPSGVYGAAIRP
jgi:hypothetical protein